MILIENVLSKLTHDFPWWHQMWEFSIFEEIQHHINLIQFKLKQYQAN